MKKIVIGFAFLIFSSSFAQNPGCNPGEITTANDYRSIQWYRTSAEKNALYREIFLLGEEQIKMKKRFMKLRPQQWGVIFDIDETLVDNSQHSFENALRCQELHSNGSTAYFIREASIATPGAKQITCAIKKMGGYVSLVSNRNGHEQDPKTGKNLLEATAGNLNKLGICYDQIVLANSVDGNKNNRFKAVATGNYPADMIVSKKLPAHRIIAFFGDNIQDFPEMFQKKMDKENPNSSSYGRFGVSYFILPNPLYGSWQENRSK